MSTTAEAGAGYPSMWEADVILADGGTMHIRPVKPSDADAIVALHHRLSADTIYLRFFSPLPNLSAPMLKRFVNVDYIDRMALVAELGDELVAVARYDRLPVVPDRAGGAEAEVAFTVDDAQQGRGIGTIMLEHLAAAAKHAGIARFVADTLPNNRRMLNVFHEAGFGDERIWEEGVIRVTFPIEPTEASVHAMHERERQAAARSVRRLLAPKSVAVIGASRQPDSIGQRLLRNLLEGRFAGPVYPVHPTAHHVASVRAYPSVLDVPDQVDLAVIVVPAASVAAVVAECAKKRVGGLVVISSGFAERDRDGAARERELVTAARRHGMRVVGPNCIGVINTDPDVRLNATFSPVTPVRGRIGFLSQSGGLGVVLLDELARRGMGVSTFVSAGNKSDVSSNDLLQYWDSDVKTDLVLLYLESFGNPRTFARVARRFSRNKPIVAVKSGRSLSGNRAASRHTAALAATDTAVDALFRQTGVIRVDSLPELFDVAQALASAPLPAGRRVAIVGNAGGPGVLCADACEAAGLTVPELSDATQARLLTMLKPGSMVANPVDLDPEATPGDLQHALAAVLGDAVVDAAIAIFLRPLAPSISDVATAIASAAAGAPDKPVLASVLGRSLVLPTTDNRLGPAHEPGPASTVPSFAFPEAAAKALAKVAGYAEWRARPEGDVPTFADVDHRAARLLVETALAEYGSGNTPTDGAAAGTGNRRPPADPTAAEVGISLDAASAMRLMAAYRIAVAATEQVKQGVETVVEVVSDPLFGPLVAFGTVGRAVEDLAFRALPLSDVDARELVTSLPGAPSLLGRLEAAGADLATLEELLLRVGRLAEDLPEVVELLLDPVIASPAGAIATRVTVRLAPVEPHPGRALRRLR